MEDLFAHFSKNDINAEIRASLLNRIIAIYNIKTEIPFKVINFVELNKSSYFKSNQALLHIYYTITHFFKYRSNTRIGALDFVNEMQNRILPISDKNNGSKTDSQKNKDNEKISNNRKYLKKLDCGILSPYLDQRVIPFGFEDGYLRRPDFKFKLWFETDREFENLQQYKKTLKKKKKIQSTENSIKLAFRTIFFYSADRNMKTHFSIHHSVNKILKAPALLLHILYDSKEYLNKIASSQPEHYLGLPFLQKKLEFIFSSICLFLFPEDSNKSWDSVFDNYGIILDPKMINFNLVNDFGQEFYTRVKYFLEIMLTGQAYWMNELDFQLLIYLVYIILNLAQHDASNTKNK